MSSTSAANGRRGLAVGDQLDPGEQPLAAHVTDQRTRRRELLEAFEHVRALLRGVLDQPVADDDPQDRQPRGAGDGMGGVGEVVDERGARAEEGLGDGIVHDHRAEGHIPAGEPLRGDDYVRLDPPVLDAEVAPRAPQPGDDLIGDHHDVVAIAHFADALVIAGLRRDPRAGRGDDRLAR